MSLQDICCLLLSLTLECSPWNGFQCGVSVFSTSSSDGVGEGGFPSKTTPQVPRTLLFTCQHFQK